MLETADESQLVHRAGGWAQSHDLQLVVCGQSGPRALRLENDVDVVIGRDATCQLSLAEPALSRFHARFLHHNGRVTVEDLGSRHGTWLSGQRVERAELGVGSSVRLADVLVAVTAVSRAEKTLLSVLDPSRGLAPGALYVSHAMREVRDLLQRAAATTLPVVVLGETGTGKELAAQELHLSSARRAGPLRVLNCAAIPQHLVEGTLFGHARGAFTGAERARAGIFEEASGGTVFLDEVGELSPAAQAALLRVLETGRLTRVGENRELEVDVRVISATHRDLAAMAAAGEFRVDLMHRLCVIAVTLPPLRERREEVAALSSHFLSQHPSQRTLEPAALSLLEAYSWPGNVRELRNVLARAAAFARGGSIAVDDLPESIREQPVGVHGSAAQAPAEASLRAHLKLAERERVFDALEQTGGNQRRAAALLGIPLRTFERRLRSLRSSLA
jgi:two-component system response regulator AtoC